jgi:MoaA/NifB/PqqE/SkfB family radical SAM enzyme
MHAMRTTWESFGLLHKGRAPRQLVLQLTERCNARCPQCGMAVTNTYTRTTMPLQDAARIIDHAGGHRFSALSITGGEPFLYFSAVTALVARAREAGITSVRTGTNGFLFRDHRDPDFERRAGHVARTLREAGLTNLWISIDSADPRMHEETRGMPGIWEGIRRALPVFHENGLYLAANIGLTRLVGRSPLQASDPAVFAMRARRSLEEVFAAVIDLGFTMANVCYPMSLPVPEAVRTAVYRATSPSFVVQFAPAEKAALYGALLDLIPSVRSRLRLFTPRCSLEMLRQENLTLAAEAGPQPAVEPRSATGHSSGAPRVRTGVPYPCRGGIDFFFIPARSKQLYPCGYRGDEPLGSIFDFDFDDPATPSCTRCEWECFRDPSELLGPLIDLRHVPAALVRRQQSDPERLRLWFDDLRYALACDLFDARRPPDRKRLARFAPDAEIAWRESIRSSSLTNRRRPSSHPTPADEPGPSGKRDAASLDPALTGTRSVHKR